MYRIIISWILVSLAIISVIVIPIISIKRNRCITPITFVMMIVVTLMFFALSMAYDTYNKEQIIAQVEHDLSKKYVFNDLSVWYGGNGFNFINGELKCRGITAKKSGHYDIARKPNGDFKVKCKLTKEVKWQPVYVNRTS